MNNNDLLKSHELLDEVGRIAKIGGWEMDLITRRAKWTKGTYDIVEIDYDNPVPGPDEHVSFYLPEDRPIIVESMRRLIEDDIPLDFEARLKTAKGKIKWCRALGKAVRENGKCVRVYGTFQDITEHKIAEQALWEATHKNEAILSAVPDIIMEVDNNKVYSWANPAGLEFFGDDVVGKEAQDYFEGEQQTYHVIQPLFNGREDLIYLESWQRRRDGQKRLLAWWCRVLRNTKGNMTGALSSARDITESKRIEEELRGIFNMSMDMICIADLKTATFIKINPAFERLLGYSESDLLKRPFLEFIHPDDRSKTEKKIVEELQKGHEVINFSNRYRCKDGSYRWLDWASHPVPALGLTYAVAHDITERISAEDAIRKSEEKFISIFNSAADGIVYLDNKGNVIEANKMLTILTGIAREELIGKNAASLAKKFLTVKDIPRVLGSIKHFLSGNSVDHFELGFNNRVLEISIPREPGSIGITAVFRDITERKQVEEKIRLQSEIMANMLEAVYLIRAKDNLIVYTNPEFERMFGYAPEEMLGKHVSIVNAPTDLSPEKTAQKIITSLKKNGIWEGEVRNIKKDGTPFWCFARVTIFDHPSFGKVLLSVHTDITERKKIFEELQKRNEYIESILDKMPIGFALNTIDDGNVKYMNTRFEEIYGWSRDVLSNVSIFFDKVFSDPDYRKKMKSQIIVDMQSGDPDRMVWDDLKIVASTGEERYVTAINIPIIDQNLMISTVQNTTTRKRAEEELKAYREHLEELVKERTKELAEKNLELERFNKLFVGREFRINELKQKIKALEERLIPVSVPETSAKKADQ